MAIDLTDPTITTSTGDTYTTSQVVTAIERRDQVKIRPEDYDIAYYWFNLTPRNQRDGWDLVKEYIHSVSI